MNTVQRTSAAGEPSDWRCQDIPTSRHCFHVSSLRGHGRPRKESFNCSCKSCFRKKKKQTKKPTNKTTQQQKSSPTSSQSVSLLELFCVIMSYWHRFCSLHERGRSRQLRVRKSQFLWKSQLLCNFFSWSTRDAQQGPSTLRRKSSFQHSGDLKRWSYAPSSFCPPAANHQN